MKSINYNKIAWSEYFNGYIRCVKYYSDTCWYFVIKEDLGCRVRKASTKYSYFNWL